MNKIEVVSLSKQSKRFEKLIQKLAGKVLKVLNKNNVLAEIYLINGQKMRFLNKKFRGKDKTTTVLSFEEPRNFILPASRFRKIGEIYLNEETRDKKQETRLLVHGLLHLFGYNHQKKSDRIRMERKEKLVMNNFYFSHNS
jgi:probable rRNA maturation factor